MLHRSRIVLGLISMIMCWPLACRESDPVYVCDGKLTDKPLPNIRACVTGNWQIHYRRGGIGLIRQNLTNTFLEIKPDDSIYYTIEGSLKAQTKIEWKNEVSIAGSMTYTINFNETNGAFHVWVVNKIFSDTLAFYDNSSDPFGYYMTRAKH